MHVVLLSEKQALTCLGTSGSLTSLYNILLATITQFFNARHPKKIPFLLPHSSKGFGVITSFSFVMLF